MVKGQVVECPNCANEVMALEYCSDCNEELCSECMDDEGHREHEE